MTEGQFSSTVSTTDLLKSTFLKFIIFKKEGRLAIFSLSHWNPKFYVRTHFIPSNIFQICKHIQFQLGYIHIHKRISPKNVILKEKKNCTFIDLHFRFNRKSDDGNKSGKTRIHISIILFLLFFVQVYFIHTLELNIYIHMYLYIHTYEYISIFMYLTRQRVSEWVAPLVLHQGYPGSNLAVSIFSTLYFGRSGSSNRKK